MSDDEMQGLCSNNIEHIETFFLFIVAIIITIGFETNGYSFTDSIILGYSAGIICKMILSFLFHAKNIMEYVLFFIGIMIFTVVFFFHIY